MHQHLPCELYAYSELTTRVSSILSVWADSPFFVCDATSMLSSHILLSLAFCHLCKGWSFWIKKNKLPINSFCDFRWCANALNLYLGHNLTNLTVKSYCRTRYLSVAATEQKEQYVLARWWNVRNKTQPLIYVTLHVFGAFRHSRLRADLRKEFGFTRGGVFHVRRRSLQFAAGPSNKKM